MQKKLAVKDISRRDFFRRSLAGSAALGMIASPLKSWADDTVVVPALVIGSGFGGAVAALRLARAGVNTIVLERGRRWPIQNNGNTFATFENADNRCSWFSNTTPIAFIESQLGWTPATFTPYAGLMETVFGNGVVLFQGAAVGGGSLHYNAILVEPHRRVFEQLFPSQIDYEEMHEVYYPRALSIIGASPIPQDILATDYYRSTRLNLQQAQAAGFHTRLVNMGIDWDIVRKEIHGTRRPSAIAGQSWYGLNSGAKLSVDRSYLAMAEATRRVNVRPLHEVVSIEETAIGRRLYYRVSADEITVSGQLVGRHTFLTPRLFLAAGSLGTTKLLLKAKAAGTLTNLSNQVGKNWAGNGDFVVLRAGLPPNNAGTGGTCGHFIMEDYLDRNVDLDNPAVPPPNGMVELVTPPHFVTQIRDAYHFGNPSTYVGMGIHPAIGSISYDPQSDNTTVNFPLADPALQPFLASSNKMLNTLNSASPGSFTLVSAPNVTAHPLGGAVMGKVCDQFGRVLGNPGLYVVDGSLLPGLAGCVNPSWTITAIAERSMEHIIEEDFQD